MYVLTSLTMEYFSQRLLSDILYGTKFCKHSNNMGEQTLGFVDESVADVPRTRNDVEGVFPNDATPSSSINALHPSYLSSLSISFRCSSSDINDFMDEEVDDSDLDEGRALTSISSEENNMFVFRLFGVGDDVLLETGSVMKGLFIF